ncbi:MAG: hypothetical protein LUG18_00520 [Candidatus Azobacteroides sp.]|nr:hypothetical protein [Candidatus Azobacteroides sp.]
MKKHSAFWKRGSFLSFLILLTGAIYGQSDKLEPGDNPVLIVPTGEPVEFTASLEVIQPYTNAYLAIDAPAGWNIIDVSPTGTIESDNKSARITFASLSTGVNQHISVTMQPDCSIVQDATITYRFYNSANSLIFTSYSNPISNIKYPAFAFTTPADTTIRGIIPAYREWQIMERDDDAYTTGGHLTIQVTSQPGNQNSSGITPYIRILGVEMFTNDYGWIPINATINPDQLSYTYTFTEADIKQIGNGDGRFGAQEVIRVREQIKFDYCSGIGITTNPTLKYALSHTCSQTAIEIDRNGTSTISFRDPYYQSVTTNSTMLSVPEDPTIPGKVVVELKNTSELYMADVSYMLTTGVSSGSLPGWIPEITAAYFSDASGNPDPGAPAVVFNNNTSYNSYTFISLVEFISTQPYKGLVAMDPDGICNDLTATPNGESIFLTIEYNVNLDEHITPGCDGTYNEYLFSNDFRGIVNYYSPECHNAYSGSQYLQQQEIIGFTSVSAYVDNPNLVLDSDDTTIMHVTDNAQGQTKSILLDNPGSSHQVKIKLPADLEFEISDGITINGTAVAGSDIEYDKAGTNTITFYNRNPATMNTSLVYNFKVKAIATGITTHNVDITHIFNWGSQSYEYSCYSTNVTYLIRVEGDCDYIVATSQRSERTSVGYKNKNREPFGSLEEARQAGVDLSVAGPYDDVEFEIQGVVVGTNVWEDDGKPLYGQIYYMNNQTDPYFTKGEGARLQYKKPGGIWSEIIEIPADAVIVTTDDTPGSHRLQVDISPYLVNAGVSLVEDTELKITLLARATGSLPTTKTAVNMLELGIYSPEHYQYGCNLQQDNFFVFNYGLNTSNVSSNYPNTMSLYANGQEGHNTEILLKLSMENTTNYVATTEVFPNEYRPNEILNGFTWRAVSGNSAQTILVDRIYDSEGNIFYNGTDYTVAYEGTGTSITFRSNLNIYTGEYYRTRDGINQGDTIGQQAYYVFADVSPICIGSQITSSTYTIASLNRVKYPTSASPLKTSGSGNGVPTSRFYNWNVTTSTTQASESTGSNIFSWPLKLRNSSTWATNSGGANTTIPYTYLFIELISGELVDFELYQIVNGTEIKIDAPFEYYSGSPAAKASGWIKIGEITGTPSYAYADTDFILKARNPDCTSQSVSQIKVEFGVNATTYPENPWAGFTQYGTSRCGGERPDITLNATFLPMDFSGTTEDTESMQPDETYILCEPIILKNTYSNNFSAEVADLEIKIYRDSETALTLSDPATTIYYTQGGITHSYDDTWTIENNRDYIRIILPETTRLAGYGDSQGRDELVVTFSVVTGCDFIFGEPIYMDMYGSSLCGIVQFDDISTRNIDLYGYDADKNPVVKLNSFSMLQINNGNNDGGSGNYHIYPYLKESDGKFRLTGTIDYQTTDVNTSAYAYINLPDNFRLTSGGTNILTRSDNTASSTFTIDGNVIQAPFPQIENTLATYTFSVDVEAYNPQVWDCAEYDLNVGVIVSSPMQCGSSNCEVKNAVSTENHQITLQKYDVKILTDSVSFTEHYDYNLNQGRITVKASLVNNSTEDINNLELYLYRDANANGVYDETDTPVAGVTLPYITLPAGGQIDISEEVEIADVADLCQLMLVMPKRSGVNMYLCDSAFVKTPLKYDLAIDSYSICQTDEILLGDPQIGNYFYKWEDMTGACDLLENNLAQSRMKIVVDSYLGGSAQTQRVKLIIDRDPQNPGNCLSEELYINVYVEPLRSDWVGASSTWEDPDNWSNGIPGKCTYVYVPGTTPYYPVLDKALTDVEAARCDTIEFAHGAEVAKTHLLDYNAAKINLNLDPDRWTMISAPLRHMHTGDYYVNEYEPNSLTWGRTPNVYWMYFRMANPQNEKFYNAEYYWSMPFNILEERMEAGKGLLVWPDLETNMTAETSGRIAPADNTARFTFPRMEDEYYYYNGSGFSDPGYTGTELEGDRALYPGTTNIWLAELERKNAIDSDSLRSRFTYEGLPTYNPATGEFVIDAFVNDASSATALVGNPFMAHLNLQAFQQANAGIIQTDFYVWSNTNSGGFFEAVKMLDDNMTHVSTSDFLPVIPPMQAFIVVKQPGTSTFNTFTFTPDMAVTSPGSKLRSAGTPETFNIALYNIEDRESAVTIIYKKGTNDNSYDQYTMFPAEGGARILYALSDYSGSKRAVSIRSVGSPEEVIPLAIRTNKTGDLLKFRLNDAESFAPYYDVYLEDRERGTYHDLTQSDYVFTNYTGNIDEGRFYLRFTRAGTGIEESWEHGSFHIYGSNCEGHIFCENDPIHEVSVFNLQGQLIHMAKDVHSENYDFAVNNCQDQVLIIRVKTEKEIRTRKIIMNR